MYRANGYAVAGLLLLGVGAGAAADQTDKRLDGLFERLRHPASMQESQAAEQAIWEIWTASGREDVDVLMRRGIGEMAEGRLDEAIDTFSRVIRLAPAFAEGWNKRATAYYLNHELAASVSDIERTLKLEPRHFGAISGMGLIFLERGDNAGALEAFEEVLKINPNALGTRARIERLRAILRRNLI